MPIASRVPLRIGFISSRGSPNIDMLMLPILEDNAAKGITRKTTNNASMRLTQDKDTVVNVRQDLVEASKTNTLVLTYGWFSDSP